MLNNLSPATGEHKRGRSAEALVSGPWWCEFSEERNGQDEEPAFMVWQTSPEKRLALAE